MDKKIEDVYKIPNYVNKMELNYLRNVIKDVKDKDGSIVNVGVYYGASAAALLLGMNDNNITGSLFLIDIFKYHNAGKPKIKPFRERDDILWSDIPIDEVKKYIHPFSSPDKKIIYIEAFSDDVSLENIGDISLIFIDGDHTVHGCLLDALKYSQKVIKGGIMLFHDYTHFKSVKKAIKIFCELRKDFIVQDIYNTVIKIKKID